MKILLIDSDDDVAETFKEFFEFCGHDCEIANDRITSILQMFSKKFDAIFANLPLPDLDYAEFVAIMDANDPQKKIKTIIVSNENISSKEIILNEIGRNMILKNLPSLRFLEKNILEI